MLKRTLTTVFTFLLIFSFSLQLSAQNKKRFNWMADSTSPQRKNIITTFPFSFIGGSILLGYERQYATKKGLKLLAGVGAADRSRYYSLEDNNSVGTTRNYIDNMSSYYVELQPRFYITENNVPMNGLYMAPVLLYKQMNFDLTIEQDDFMNNQQQTTKDVLEGKVANAFSIGYVIGYQAILKSTLALDLYMGGGMMRAMKDHKLVNTQLGVDSYRNGIVIHLGAALGVAF